MPRAPHAYVALLRALNVGGHAVVPMPKLVAMFEAFGAAGVSTYIQSGNVLFSSDEADRAKLARALEAHLARAIGKAIGVFLFTREELEEAAAKNPFDPAAHPELQCHLVFLDRAPERARVTKLAALEEDEYRFAVRGRVLYMTYAKALAGKRKAIDLERVLDVRATARTWKVVDALVRLAAATSGDTPGALPSRRRTSRGT